MSRPFPSRLVSQRLRPTARDYFVLKPKHSGFCNTTLDTLLGSLGTRRVILTGIAGWVPVYGQRRVYARPAGIRTADCIVSNTVADNDHVPRQIETLMKGHVAPSTQFRFRGRGRTRKDQRL